MGSFRAGCVDLSTLNDDLCRGVETAQTSQFVCTGHISGTNSSSQNSSSLAQFCLKTRGISSQAGAESGGEDEVGVDDEFSELGTPNSDTIKEKNLGESNEDLLSGPELSDDDEAHDTLTEVSPVELDLSDSDQNASKESSSKHKPPAIYKVLMSANRNSLIADLDKWEKGNSITQSDISLALLNLRKRQLYMKALQFCEWLEAKGNLDFSERDYVSRLDLIAKVRGLNKAEKYIADIPESFRGEIIYRTLLANAVSATNLNKAEAVFNKMRDLGFSMTAFACNQLLLLYKRLDRKKIADVLLFMEKENILPTLFTYRLLIDTKGQSNDITGMEKLLETMKEQGIEPDHTIQAMIAKYYVRGGLTEKAEAVLKEMEGGDLKGNRAVHGSLLTLYAELGKADEVGRIWKMCKSKTNTPMEEYLAAIEAWGKLGKIEEAEAVFEKMAKTWKKLPAKGYTTLLRVYANHKLLVKGKELTKRMADSGSRIGPWTWDALVKLYVEAGELEKADSILQKAVQQKQIKALFSTYMYVMDQYAKRGDIHNAEKIFHNLKQAGYVGRIRQYQSLLDAYINAKTPVYGFRERMKADDLFPNKLLQGKLAQIDAFKKTAITDLLD